MTDANTVSGSLGVLGPDGWQIGAAPVQESRREGVTGVAAVFRIPPFSGVRAFPTAAGLATVYSSSSPADLVNADLAIGAAAIQANTNAQWTAWTAGEVSTDTEQLSDRAQTCVAIVVASGTWVLEVARGES